MSPFRPVLLSIFICTSLSTTLYTTTSKPLVYYALSQQKHSNNEASKTASVKSQNDNLPSGRNQWRREIIINPEQANDGSAQPSAYPNDCLNEKDCETLQFDSSPSPTFKPFSQEELDKFLKEYAEKYGRPPSHEQEMEKLTNSYEEEPVNIVENGKNPGGTQDKSKAWHLIQAQTHNHPYDDHTGWVTLEPVPWSTSQVQKWEPNKHKRPQLPQWESPEPEHWNKPSKWQDRPWSKPTYDYKPSSNRPQQWNDNQNNWNKPPNPWQEQWSSHPDIITDGRPGEFPQDPPHRPWGNSYSYRPQTEVVYHGEKGSHPPGYPSDGDGQWVLLSSTKGYSYPHRNRGYQRALKFNSNPQASLSSHRTVRLTVLPALNGTTNTTTSHGGLLEVEQTFQTVDESQREHAAKMMRLETVNQTSRSPEASKRSGTAVRIYPIKTAPSASKKSAVLAAVGAGMIPATMAMMLPMVLGRKRRSLNSEHFQHLNLKTFFDNVNHLR